MDGRHESIVGREARRLIGVDTDCNADDY